MRPATSDGWTLYQLTFKRNMKYISIRSNQEIGLQGVGPNIWVGYDKPVFKFVSFAPTVIGVDARIRDGLTVSPGDIKRLEANDSAFVRASWKTPIAKSTSRGKAS
jgi:hypothetical protein